MAPEKSPQPQFGKPLEEVPGSPVGGTLEETKEGKTSEQDKAEKLIEYYENRLKEVEDKKELSPEEKIIEKALKGETLSEKEIELWRKIKEKKIQEELKTEIRELREKKQRGEVLSEEEERRLKMLKLKWDIFKRSKEIKKEMPEKKPEEVRLDLDLTRFEYASAYNEYRKAFGGMKKRN